MNPSIRKRLDPWFKSLTQIRLPRVSPSTPAGRILLQQRWQCRRNPPSRELPPGSPSAGRALKSAASMSRRALPTSGVVGRWMGNVLDAGTSRFAHDPRLRERSLRSTIAIRSRGRGAWRPTCGGYTSVMCMPLADRLNRNPPVCECSLTTTPFSFLSQATEPPSTIVRPAVTAVKLPSRSAGLVKL